MLNLSDKELDRLSREAAEKYEVEQDPAAWHKLNQLLDKELGRSSPMPRLPGLRSPFLYAPAMILLIGVTYFLIKTSKHTSTSTQKNNSSVTIKKAGNASANSLTVPVAKTGKKTPVLQQAAHASSSPDKQAIASQPQTLSGKGAKAPLSQNQLKEDNQDNALREQDAKKEGKTFEINNTKSVSANTGERKKQFTEKSGNKTTGEISTETNLPADRENIAANHPGINNNDNKIVKKNSSTKNGIEQTEKTVNDISGIDKNSSATKNSSKKQADKPVVGTMDDGRWTIDHRPSLSNIEPVYDKTGFVINDSLLKRLHINNTAVIKRDIVNLNKKPTGRKLYTNRSLQFGVVFAPDFSEVKYNYNNKIGNNIGFTISYQLPGSFSVNSGFIFTKKNYDVQGYDFHLPPNCGIDQDDLDFAICTSHIYEIPLNLRYDVNKSGNSSFFVSAGLSSYIMKKENFKFYLHDNNIGFRRWQNATYETNHAYLFSVLNISAGFETKISNSFSVEVEPYLKLPFTGIGFGNVDLNSYGINIALKFAPLLGRARK